MTQQMSPTAPGPTARALLAILPFAFRVQGSAELCRATADLGRRLLASAAAADSGPEPSF
jgi:hypothetical protein